MREVVSRCDMCKAEPATTFTVRNADVEVDVELCETHAKPLLRIVAAGRPVTSHLSGTVPRPGLRSLEERIRGI